MHVKHRVHIGREEKAIMTLHLQPVHGVLMSHYLLDLGVNIGDLPPTQAIYFDTYISPAFFPHSQPFSLTLFG